MCYHWPSGQDAPDFECEGGSPSGDARDSPRLPQELVDLVIDQLAHDGDLQTLQTCSFIASSWLPRCRSHLFSVVCLHPNNFEQMEGRFRPSRASSSSASASPLSSANAVLIAQCVRRVLLHAGTRDEDEQPVPRDAELRASLLSLFPNADRLDLVNVRWYCLRADVRRYFSAGTSTMSHRLSGLTMRDVGFHKLGDLVGLIKSLRGLKTLHLRNVIWGEQQPPLLLGVGGSEGGGGGSSSGCSLGGSGADMDLPQRCRVVGAEDYAGPRLRDVEIYECTSACVFMSHLFCEDGCITGSRIQRLALDWRGREEDPGILRNLILEAGASLQILEVDLSWQHPAVPLDFRLNTSLRELYLDGLLLDHGLETEEVATGGTQQQQRQQRQRQEGGSSGVSWVPTVLSGISSWCMRRVVFYLILSYLRGLQWLHLERVDEVLSRAQFRTLECVEFSITILPNSGVPPPRRRDIWESIRSGMSRADGRGILKLMRDGMDVS